MGLKGRKGTMGPQEKTHDGRQERERERDLRGMENEEEKHKELQD